MLILLFLCYHIVMKNQPTKRFLIVLFSFIAVFALVGVILLCLGMPEESSFALIPIPFCVAAFFTFRFPKDPAKNTGLLVVSITLRFVTILLAMLVPILLWKLVPSYEGISV